MQVYQFTYKTSRKSDERYVSAPFIRRDVAESSMQRMRDAGFIVGPLQVKESA